MTAGRNNAESVSQEWCTPPEYVNEIRKFFSGTIALDPCSNRHSIVKANTEYSLPEQDGLEESWDYPSIFVNPPYGNDRERGTKIIHWLQKCSEAYSQYGAEVLALVPVATNTRHWKDYVFGDATAIAFLYDTRLKFLVNGQNGGKGAPMSCAMIYWGADYGRFEDVFMQFGAVVDIRHLRGKLIGHRGSQRQLGLPISQQQEAAPMAGHLGGR